MIDSTVLAQGGSVGIGTENPEPSAILDVSSTTKGLLIPRLTSAERDAIVKPVDGLVIYNRDKNHFEFFYNTQWHNMSNGLPGLQGIQGIKGDRGETGAQGPQGLRGDKGDTGATGPAGAQGPVGSTGPQGARGEKGETGSAGPVGAQGPAGLTGPAGPQGPKGDTGAAGPIGPQGPIGLTGPAGPQGTKGETGAIGPVGPQGPSGPLGADGKSLEWQGSFASAPVSPQLNWGYYNTTDKASYIFNGTSWQLIMRDGANGKPVYQTWLDQGNTGSEAQFLASLKGADGVNGTNGSKWHVNSSAPVSSLGAVDDFYLDNLTGDVYMKTASGWEFHMNIVSTNYWRLDGTENTNPVTDYLGTRDAKDLVIKTNRTERMRIIATGNIGIGTNTPAALLDVKGNFKLGNTGTLLNAMIKKTMVADVPALNAGASFKQTFSFAEAVTGASVSVSPAAELHNAIVISYARVSANGTVEVKFLNAGASIVDLPSMDYFITVIQ
ncbi:MAG TPA: hypothetical protein VGE26_07905 [Sphingobacteriaceae bacterium]